MTTVSRSRSTDQRFYGVVEAIVTAVADDDGLGRVRVRYPWFDDSTVSEWCRVRQLYAGPGYGTFFIPEVGDEVLVGFVHGDMRMPVILGGLYNGKDKPPTRRNDSTDEKMIRTKGGHTVNFIDTRGSEKIIIVDSGGNNTIEIDSVDNTITVKAALGKLTLEGLGVEIKSNAEMKLSATTTLDINGRVVNINS